MSKLAIFVYFFVFIATLVKTRISKIGSLSGANQGCIPLDFNILRSPLW